MNIFDGIKNFLTIINDNWTTIMVIIGLAFAIGKKIKDFYNKSNTEKIEIAKLQIRETILKLVTKAEVDYEEWNKAGSIKRAEVISQIYADYPILAKAVDQKALTEWIDATIDESLKTLRDVISNNK